MTLVGRTSLRAEMENAYRSDGCATETMIAVIIQTKSLVRQLSVTQPKSSSVRKIIASLRNGDVMENLIARTDPMKR